MIERRTQRQSSFRQYIQNLDLTIYEANAGVGGTWYSNKYPGLACDGERASRKANALDIDNSAT